MSARQTAVEFALNELAWLGSLQLALKLHQVSIANLTENLLRNPQQYSALGAGVRALSSHAKFTAGTRPGGYRNKTAMIYLVSVLESFLEDVCQKCLSPPINVQGKMFGGKIGAIRRSERIAGFDQADEVKRVNLMRVIRNVIIHNHGEVPPDFWVNSQRQYDSASRYIGAWPGNQAEFQRQYQPGNAVWLHIDEVVMPSVFCGIDFVRYMDGEMHALDVPW